MADYEARTYSVPAAKVGDPTYEGVIPATVAVARMWKLARVLEPRLRAARKELVTKALDRLRVKLRTGALSLAPLTSEYLQRKVEEGFEAETLVRTGGYVQSLKIWEQGEALVLGPDPGARSPDGKSYATLGLVLEFGSENSPARPHLQPTLVEMRASAPKLFKDNLSKMIEELKL